MDSYRWSVPLASGLYAGHFPDRPILPGFAQLALIERRLSEGDPRAPVAKTLRELAHLRWRKTLAPDESLEMIADRSEAAHAAATDLDRRKIEVRRGAEVVTLGVIALGPAGPATVPRLDDLRPPAWDAIEPLPPFLPHQPPALWIEKARRVSESELWARGCIPREHALVTDGVISIAATLELAAQATACFEAVARDTGCSAAAPPRLGFVVGARAVSFHAPSLAAARGIDILVAVESLALPLAQYGFSVHVDGAVVAEGRLSLFLAA